MLQADTNQIVIVDGLIKKYGQLVAVDNFSFSAGEKEILAIVGPDGAGKTSLFRSLCNLIDYEAGEIIISGQNIKSGFEKIKSLLGYMPQIFSLYPDLSVEENLSFYAGLFGITGDNLKQKKKELYHFSGLEPFAKRRASALSGGMKQKLALSCNLVHDPKILFLDEPTTGVDPLSRRQFWEILKSLRDNGSTIIVSTPYMDEVALSDRAIFIFQGKKLAEGTPAQLAGQYDGEVYHAELFLTADQLRGANELPGINLRRFGSAVHLYLNKGASPEQYHSQLAHFGIEVERFERVEPEIEDSFIQLMGQS